MMENDAVVEIKTRDYWFKIVEFLQQNWALIDANDKGVVVWSFGGTAGVFDQLSFIAAAKAEGGLRRNGFRKYADDPEAKGCIALPQGCCSVGRIRMASFILASVTGSKTYVRYPEHD